MRIVGSLLALATGLSAAACGSVNTNGGDDVDAAAGAPDAALNGSVAITTNTRCMTECVNPGQGQRDVVVFVNGPDGELKDSGVSGTDGTLDLDVTAGDSITAVYVNADQGARITTYYGVKPGDHLRFGDDFQVSPTSNYIGDMTIGFPAVAGVNYYQIYTPCGSFTVSPPSLSGVTSFYDNCVSGPMVISAVAYDVNGDPIAFSRQTGINFTSGGVSNVSGWTTASTIHAAVSGLQDIQQVQMVLVALEGRQFRFNVSTGGTPVGGAFAADLRFAAIGDAILGETLYLRSAQLGPQIRLDTLTPTATEYTPDEMDLPWLGDLIANPAAREVTWVQTDGGTYDGAVAELRYSHFPPGLPQQNIDYFLIIPPGVERVPLPEFPASVAAHEFLEGDSFSSDPYMYLMDYGADDGYDDTRARPESQLDQILFGGGDLAAISPFKLAASVGLN